MSIVTFKLGSKVQRIIYRYMYSKLAFKSRLYEERDIGE